MKISSLSKWYLPPPHAPIYSLTPSPHLRFVFSVPQAAKKGRTGENTDRGPDPDIQRRSRCAPALPENRGVDLGQREGRAAGAWRRPAQVSADPCGGFCIFIPTPPLTPGKGNVVSSNSKSLCTMNSALKNNCGLSLEFVLNNKGLAYPWHTSSSRLGGIGWGKAG